MKARIYFSGLDGIRFWAALFVLVGHIEQLKSLFRITDGTVANEFIISRLVMSGEASVMMFFVLSGFLITYLLLVEIERTSTVSVKDFYVRRTLRIWPLYYLLVFIGFFLVPVLIKVTQFDGYYVSVSQNFALKFGLFTVFLPNVLQTMMASPVGISQLWSIGVEEYFYLMWAPLIKALRKNILPAILGVWAFRLLAIAIAYFRVRMPDYEATLFDTILGFINLFHFESMAIGGLCAYLLYHNHERWLKWIYHPMTTLVLLALMGMNMLISVEHMYQYMPVVGRSVVSIVFALFIINVATNPRFPIHFKWGFYKHLGQLSYGIYMYHVVLIYVILIGFDLIGYRSNDVFYNFLLYSVVIAATLGVSHLSYDYFETPFLRIKERFAIVKSGHALSSEASV